MINLNLLTKFLKIKLNPVCHSCKHIFVLKPFNKNQLNSDKYEFDLRTTIDATINNIYDCE